MSEQIRVSTPVKDTLERIRDEGEHSSLDSAVRELAHKASVEVSADE